MVKAAAEELQWVEFAERISQQDNDEITGEHAPLNLPVARFDVLFQDQLVAELNLKVGRAIIGRTPDNDLQIRSKFISRHHAQIVTDRRHSVVEDLNSTNGVFIRSKRVKHHELADGDVIQLGEHKLLYRDMRGMMAHVHEHELDADEPDDDDDDDDDERDLDADETEAAMGDEK